MIDYATYSKNAFLDLKDEYKKEYFALYQPKDDENLVIYANRRGLVHVWKKDVETGDVSITCHTISTPSELTEEVFNELKTIAKRKHWRGGVHKLRHYLRHVGEHQLNDEGLDPFFYAWIVQYNVAYDDNKTWIYNCDYFDCFNDILCPKDFAEVNLLAEIVGGDAEEIAKKYASAKGDIVAYTEFANNILQRNTRYNKVYHLLDEELPMCATQELRQKLALEICELIGNAEESITTE